VDHECETELQLPKGGIGKGVLFFQKSVAFSHSQSARFGKNSRCHMLHWWLIPSLVLFWILIGIFYLTIKYKGGSGVRQEGRTLVDKPSEEEDPPAS
jgi:hypothetical protein